jgi:hypothetical protein
MVDDLAGARDGMAVCDIAGGGKERNLGYQVLGVLGFRVLGLTGVRSPELGRFRGRSGQVLGVRVWGLARVGGEGLEEEDD